MPSTPTLGATATWRTCLLFTVPQGWDADGFTSAVVCYSAGPDEEVDTSFSQPGGWSTGDDDVTALLNAAGSR